MATVWQIAIGLLRASSKHAGVRLELMNNEELDLWLKDRLR